MDHISQIEAAWSWTGLLPRAVIAENDFGNLIVEDVQGRYWRICPEELSCIVVSGTRAGWDELSASPEFQEDWEM
jgi:hypothetical protein